MQALILNNTIVQVVEDDKVFEVHEDMTWVKCPESTTTEWTYKDGSFVELQETDIAYDVHRRFNYPSIPDQLDILFHEGYDGWKAVIQAVKDKYPKE